MRRLTLPTTAWRRLRTLERGISTPRLCFLALRDLAAGRVPKPGPSADFARQVLECIEEMDRLTTGAA